MAEARHPSSPIRGATAREIAASIETAIQQGTLQPGDILPSVRRLAAELDVSPMTVMGAFKDLRVRGVVTTHERRRTRVSPRPPIARRSAIPLGGRLRDLASDNPDQDLLPDVGAALRRITIPKVLYGGHVVLDELRAMAREQFRCIGVAATDVAVVNGTFDAIERALQSHTKPGDPVIVEDPGYTGVLDLVRALGLEPVGVRIDDRGMDPDAFGAALRRGAVAAIYTPRAQNPTGAAVDRERAGELARAVAKHPQVLLIEDDHAGPVCSAEYFTLTADRERWIVVRSVSKSLGPDLRLAVVAGDQAALSRVEGRQLLASGWVSHIVQRLVVALWKDRRVQATLQRAERLYDERRRTLLHELALRGIPATGRSGLNAWIPVAEEATASRNLLALGWSVANGEIFRINAPPALRVTTAALPLEDIPSLADDIAYALRPERRTNRA